jgi:hypothetical protein
MNVAGSQHLSLRKLPLPRVILLIFGRIGDSMSLVADSRPNVQLQFIAVDDLGNVLATR